ISPSPPIIEMGVLPLGQVLSVRRAGLRDLIQNPQLREPSRQLNKLLLGDVISEHASPWELLAYLRHLEPSTEEASRRMMIEAIVASQIREGVVQLAESRGGKEHVFSTSQAIARLSGNRATIRIRRVGSRRWLPSGAPTDRVGHSNVLRPRKLGTTAGMRKADACTRKVASLS